MSRQHLPEDGHDEIVSLYAEFGLADETLPEDLAPPVNEKILQRMVRREVRGGSYDLVIKLVTHFRKWRDAYSEILLGLSQNLQMTNRTPNEDGTADDAGR